MAVVGAGAVGTALARRLGACGYAVRAVLSRSRSDAQALAERVGASVASTELKDLPSAVRLVMLCVPDEAIGSVGEHLAALDHPWPRTIVAHTSGRKTAAALAPLAQAGALTLSFHPLQTFTPDTPPEAFEGIAVGVEGDREAVAAGRGLAEALGARPVVLAAEDKARYHAAAALASNGLAALMSVVQEVLPPLAEQEDDPAALFGPLVEQTWENVKKGGAEGALTGPVARGDRDTVTAHLEALKESTPHLVPLYAALSTEMARIAIRRGSLAPREARPLLKQLREAVQSARESSQ